MRIASISSVSLFAILTCFTVPGWCQDQATILGIVTDSSGASVAGAKVTVANSQRGVTRETTSNSDGDIRRGQGADRRATRLRRRLRAFRNCCAPESRWT